MIKNGLLQTEFLSTEVMIIIKYTDEMHYPKTSTLLTPNLCKFHGQPSRFIFAGCYFHV